MPGIKIKLRPISDSIPRTGVYGKDGEYEVGHILTLPEGVDLVGSGYERHEVLTKATTKAHTGVNNDATSGTEGAGVTKDHAQTEGVDGDDENEGGDTPRRYVARESSPGWFAVFEGETEVEGVTKMRKADADEFNAADDDTQAKFVAGDSGEAV